MIHVLPGRPQVILDKIEAGCIGSFEDGPGDFLGNLHAGDQFFLREFENSLIMCFGDYERMSRVDRIYVQEADHAFIFIDLRRRELALYNLAEDAIRHDSTP